MLARKPAEDVLVEDATVFSFPVAGESKAGDDVLSEVKTSYLISSLGCGDC